jgi:nickel-dependent lactate racemase
MCETLGALKRVFGINFFADRTGDIAFLNAGDPIQSHVEACEAYRDAHTCTIEDPYSVVVLSAGGYPRDMNFLQSHKALRHAAAAVKSGGSVLYYAECEEGIGSESLGKALSLKKKDFLSTAFKDYDLNNQTAVSLHGLSERFEIGMVSAMNVDTLLSCGIKPCVNAEAFLAEALDKHNTDKIAVILDGGDLLVRLKAGGE